jgi:hypothetical protein
MKRYIGFIAVIMLLALVLLPGQGHAQINVFTDCGKDASSAICKATGDKIFGAGGIWNKILNILTYVIGAVAVLVIVVGGLRYTISGGDSKAISDAKNTIIYASVGLVVAIMANAIVNFVLTNI